MAAIAVNELALLSDLERLLVDVGHELPALSAGMRPYLQRGKRMRSKLLFTIGSAGPAVDREALVRYAAFVELVHAGGLCHDDVVDRSETRRGRPSIGALYGAPAATHAGLFLMARAFESVAADDGPVRSWIADAAVRVARGQAREMCDLYREDVSVEEYLERSSDKTAALFELAARLAAFGGGFGENEQDALSQYGAAVGLAFQLADDVRDMVGGEALGRERGTDVREGVYTLPILLTLSRGLDGAKELRRAMRKVRLRRDQATIERCCEIVVGNGGLNAAAAIMRGQMERAVMLAHRMPGPLARVLSTVAIRTTHGVGVPLRPRL